MERCGEARGWGGEMLVAVVCVGWALPTASGHGGRLRCSSQALSNWIEEQAFANLNQRSVEHDAVIEWRVQCRLCQVANWQSKRCFRHGKQSKSRSLRNREVLSSPSHATMNYNNFSAVRACGGLLWMTHPTSRQSPRGEGCLVAHFTVGPGYGRAQRRTTNIAFSIVNRIGSSLSWRVLSDCPLM